jgi:inhibitor of cysteine peptidase
VRVDASWHGRAVALAPGETLEVALAEVPTAGYRWRVEDDGAPVCRLAADDSEPPAAGAVGGAGVRRLAFEVVARGSARIALAYGRGWSGAAPARRFTIDVDAR